MVNKNFLTVCLAFFIFFQINAQRQTPPKLMVGIVVDQMRAEYLYRFYGQFGDGGFKRLMDKGFNCRNVHYNYIPTYTGPGHTSIYTGTVPQYHGIVGNNWYDRKLKRSVYCADDSSEETVGNEKNEKKSYSARNILATTVTDELKISTNLKAKVIAVSLKDRASAFPAGHMADGAFWFDHITGNFVSSTYYMKTLPSWVTAFNNEKRPLKYLDNTWSLLLPEDTYGLSLLDNNRYEGIPKGKTTPTFPYNLKELSTLNPPLFEMVYRSPFGNNLLTDLAIEALKGAGLGKGAYPDFLAISYSSPDAVGHFYGPLSKEVNDTYVRLDRDIARLLEALDQWVGKDNYTVFLTADHGVDEVPKYLMDHKVPAGYFDTGAAAKEAQQFLTKQFGEGKWIESTMNEQFYLNRTLIKEKGLDLANVQNQLAAFIREIDGVSKVYTATQLDQQEFTKNMGARVQNGFFYKRSGDVKAIFEPGWTDDMVSTSTHGTGYTYDTQVPLLWYGHGIVKGESVSHYNITDIAPTVSMLLRIKLPSACIGDPIKEVIFQ